MASDNGDSTDIADLPTEEFVRLIEAMRGVPFDMAELDAVSSQGVLPAPRDGESRHDANLRTLQDVVLAGKPLPRDSTPFGQWLVEVRKQTTGD